jgi:hypothetical protein
LPEKVLKEPILEVHKVMGKPMLLHESEYCSSTNMQEEKALLIPQKYILSQA